MNLQERIDEAMEIIERFGQIDGDHHKTWVIDQVVRKLIGDNYEEWKTAWEDGEDGPGTYQWDCGCPP